MQIQPSSVDTHDMLGHLGCDGSPHHRFGRRGAVGAGITSASERPCLGLPEAPFLHVPPPELRGEPFGAPGRRLLVRRGEPFGLPALLEVLSDSE